MTLSEFLFEAGHKHAELRGSNRIGQILFNTLNVIRPDLSVQISGVTELDPYYRDSWTDPVVYNFIKFLEENW